MSAIRDGGKVKARERIAVLAALNLAFELAQRPPRAGSAVATNGNDGDESPVDLDHLVRRIDIALGADGQLL